MNTMYPSPPAASSESQKPTKPVSSVCKDNLRRDLEEKLAQTLVQEIIDDTKEVNKGESEIDVVFEDDEPVLTIDLNEKNDDDWLKRMQKLQEGKDEPKNEVEELKKDKEKIALKDISNELDEIVDVEVEEIVRRKDGVKYDEKIYGKRHAKGVDLSHGKDGSLKLESRKKNRARNGSGNNPKLR